MLKLKVLALLVTLGIAGCKATPEPVLDCRVPARPKLVEIDAGQLWDKVGPDTYNALQQREKELVDWALELEAISKEVCNG
jgi:hypothetical protein